VRYLTLSEVLELHRRVIGQSGGALGVLNLSALESVLAQTRMTFGAKDLYPSIVWRKRQRLATRLSRTIHSWTETNGPDTQRWKFFYSSMTLRFNRLWMSRKQSYCRWRPVKWIGKLSRVGFAITLPQDPEEQRLTMRRFRSIAKDRDG